MNAAQLGEEPRQFRPLPTSTEQPDGKFWPAEYHQTSAYQDEVFDKQRTGTFNFSDYQHQIPEGQKLLSPSDRFGRSSSVARLRLSEEAQSIIDSLTQFIQNERLAQLGAEE